MVKFVSCPRRSVGEEDVVLRDAEPTSAGSSTATAVVLLDLALLEDVLDETIAGRIRTIGPRVNSGELTERQGLDELAAIPEKLSGEAELKPLHREAPLWDNWLTLALLVATYSVDVGIRRLLGLS